jgi:two-component system response regulator
MCTDEILLVEDNPDDVTLTMWAFRKCGVTNNVVVAGDGAAALELLLPTDGRAPLYPAIVLLDINMPKIGGLEVLRRLRADPSTHALPIIMLTSSIHDQDIAESYDSGANSYLQKPVNSQEFLTAARTMGVYWLQLNRPHPAGVPAVASQGALSSR